MTVLVRMVVRVAFSSMVVKDRVRRDWEGLPGSYIDEAGFAFCAVAANTTISAAPNVTPIAPEPVATPSQVMSARR